MRLKDINTDKGVDVFTEIIIIFKDLLNNEKIKNVMVNKLNLENLTPEDIKKATFEMGIEKITDVLLVLLKENKEDTYKLCAILTDKTVDELKEQPLFTTLGETTETFINNYEDLKELFILVRQ